MTLQTLNPIYWPGMGNINGGTPGISATATLDAAGEYVAAILQAREAMNISHVGIVCNAVAGSPTATISIETLSAGLPSGTLWNSGTTNNCSRTTGTLSAGTMEMGALTGATGTINPGDFFAVKVAYLSGTSLNLGQVGSWSLPGNVPYMVTNTGTPAKAAMSSGGLCIVLGSDASTFYYVPGLIPHVGVAANAFNNTNSARQGALFQVPFKCRASGIRVFLNGQGGAFNFGIWDEAGSEVGSSITAFDSDNQAGTGSRSTYLYFDNPVTLSPGTNYRVAIEPTSATNSALPYFNLSDANHRQAMPGGTNFFHTTYASGAWTDTATTKVPMIDLIIDQLDDGAGGAASGGVPLIGPGGLVI